MHVDDVREPAALEARGEERPGDDAQPLSPPVREVRRDSDDGKDGVVEAVRIGEIEGDDRVMVDGRHEQIEERRDDALVDRPVCGDDQLSPRKLCRLELSHQIEHDLIMPPGE